MGPTRSGCASLPGAESACRRPRPPRNPPSDPGGEVDTVRLAPRRRATPSQVAAIEARRKEKDNHRDTQWRRRLEIEKIRSEVVSYAVAHLNDPFFVAGLVMYWAEGSKTRNNLSTANGDPRALRLFVAWVRSFHRPASEFVLKLNLREGNDEQAARAFWKGATTLGQVGFHKTFIEPRETGHRLNHLPRSICHIRVRAAADAWQRTMTWIGVVAPALQSLPPGNLPSGR